MCGIAGIIQLKSKKKDDSYTLKKMMSKIAHRGPDAEDLWQNSSNNVYFGHQRLSIIDLSINANQPMVLDGYSIIFNGEIYNHRELRNELEYENQKFNTNHSDTEVLLVGFIHWGIDKLLSKLNGMFAFAIYDKQNSNIVICRDRIGIKNLYYSEFDGRFFFCSEIKGILGAKYFEPEFDDTNLEEFLLNRSLKSPNTLFKNIYKLGAASYISIDLDSSQKKETIYWDPLNVKVDTSIKSQNDVEKKLLSLIDSSINYRLEADVPVGILLSGGVDSNYLLSRLSLKREGIKCFNASFRDNLEFDESTEAKKMADKFKADFIDVPINAINYKNSLNDVFYYLEEPVAAPVCVPVYMLSKVARAHGIPVLLAGEGADEIFIGYENWVKIRKLQKTIRKIPFIKLFAFIGKLIASKVLNITSPIHDLLDRISSGLPVFWGGALDMNYLIRNDLLNGRDRNCNLSHNLCEEILKKLKNFKAKRNYNFDSAWMTYLDLQQRLPELMLVRLDKMGMAHSVEGRVPYLDHRIVEFIFSVPESVMNEQKKIGKSALKAIAAKMLGENFVYSHKRGFQAPVSDWKKHQFSEWVELLFLFCERTKIFNIKGVNSLVKFGGRRYFTLINFMIWYLIFIDNVLYDKLPNLKRWDQY